MHSFDKLGFIEKIAYELISDASFITNFNLEKIKYNEPELIDISDLKSSGFLFIKKINGSDLITFTCDSIDEKEIIESLSFF